MNYFRKIICAAFLLGLCMASLPAEAAPVTLKFATQNAENAWSTENGLIPWLKKIETESQGTVKIDLYANQTLAKGNQVWMAVKNGIADMAWTPMSMYPGMNPLLEVVGMAGLGNTDALKGTKLLWDVYEQMESTRTPFEANKVLALFTTDNVFLITKKPVRTLEDLKGMKIRCTAGAYVQWLTALGAAPVVMPMPDVYMALQKGTIDGLLGDWESTTGFRHYDVAKYLTLNLPLGMSYFSVSMNQNKFKALPPEAQQAIEANSGRQGSMWLAEYFSYNSRSLSQVIRDKNLAEIIELSPEERTRWTALVGKPLWDKWVKDLEAKGIQGGPQALEIMSK